MSRWYAAFGLVCALSMPTFAAAQDHDVHETAGDTAEGHGTAHHDEEHAGAHHDAHAMDWTQIAGSAVNFIVLIGLIVWFARKPLGDYLRARKSGVEEALAEAQRLKLAAEAKYAEYQKRLENLDQEIIHIREDIVRSGAAERDRIVAEAEKKAARMRRDAQFQIDQQLKQLRIDLTREAASAAIRAAEKVLREKTTADDQTRLSREYLQRLGTEAGGADKTGDDSRLPRIPSARPGPIGGSEKSS